MNLEEWIQTRDEIENLWKLKPNWINLVDNFIVAVWNFGSSFAFQNNIEVKIDTDFDSAWLGWHIKITQFTNILDKQNGEKYTKIVETFDYGLYEEMVLKLKELLGDLSD